MKSNYCKQLDHIVFECLILKKKKAKHEGPKPAGLTSLRSKPKYCVKDQTHIQAKISETDSVMETYVPFLSDGFVSLNGD